ncbi:cyclopropane-fatty-acyl-phospholipid synthase [gamma proteobacterium HTCC5015]|nr:cyclopropane-fatty-acyl-phospholipid synthase [gamma proteobacterium HTCC5015]
MDLKQGELKIRSLMGEQVFGEPSDVSVELLVHDMETFERLMSGGSVGAGEAYMEGQWDCDDLVALVRLLVRNRELLDGMEGGFAAIGGALLKLWHEFRRNTRKGSRDNIAAHYDLGNDLFELFLDRDWMMYSSALYNSPDETLEQAQFNKLKRLCDKLQLNDSDHLLEVGTGWGGCAVFAAQHYGCRVTTTTISKEQHKLAVERVKAAGLEDKVEVLLKDYRDLDGRYDKLISIEMVEAVGHHFLDEYFEQCRARLKPDGLAVIQAITIEDHRYQQALNSVDFIKRYIFPGSFIPCVSVLTQSAAQAQLRLVNLEDLGDSYATTLNHWRQRFVAELERVRELGYDERFIRMWLFYLCYCEGGFIERSISDVHLLLAADKNQSPNWLPSSN